MRLFLLIALALSCVGCLESTPNADEPLVVHKAQINCNTIAPLPENGLLGSNTSETPLGNTLAEMLTLEAAGEFTAPNQLHARVTQELDLISKGLFDPNEYQPQPCYRHDQIFLNMTEEAAESARNETYQEWNSYNEHLQIQKVKVYDKFPGALLTFKGHYNILTALTPYQALQGVEVAELMHTPYVGYLGADICLASRSDQTHFYINAALESFDDEDSPCYEFNGFEVSPEQSVKHYGPWNSCSTTKPPNVLVGAEDCQAFLSIRPIPNPR